MHQIPERLLIVSHTPHFRRNGILVGWGPTIREIDHLATLFRSVVHIAPLYKGTASKSALPYSSERVRLRSVKPAGGDDLRSKFAILLRWPGYAVRIIEEIQSADVLHVRAPANISALCLLLMGVLPQPRLRWAKYAGNWNPPSGDPASYRFQRWWLAKGLHRGLVTVNGRWPAQPKHIRSFLNPCLTDGELEEGRTAGASKSLAQPVRLLFVGRLEEEKGPGVCLEVLAQLRKTGVKAELSLIGDGTEHMRLQEQAINLGLSTEATLQGSRSRSDLGQFYAAAHFILLPSSASEGWPKVLSEAMAYGVVPLASAISSIPQLLRQFATGEAIPSRDAGRYARAIESYLKTPGRWKEESRNATEAARQFSYSNFLKEVKELLGMTSAPQSFSKVELGGGSKG